MAEPLTGESADVLRTWLAERIAVFVRRPAAEIDHDVPLGEYGLDSIAAVGFIAEVEDHLDLVLDPTVLWDHPTVNELDAVLRERIASASDVDESA
ncbi:acyl carrier protein [Streptosporangium carneum]|uniref:Carrier domain-containing protein n=1 Tax=Streptosporangium carneum TaxID=47481 RepID=A0A9W6MHX0_9ACTN|nr:acyl carrier protein [Streptosporangium carneum]GLK14637.1 hypothetical protein GCM10017600_80490 [Streptosporangium carneum]